MKGKRIRISVVTPQATSDFGELLGKHLAAGDLVALTGDLGAGKTQLTKGLARGLGVPEEYHITSPTYTMINEYPGRVPLYHCDFYRLKENSELEDLGYEEYFNGMGVTVIEWADKVIDFLPENRVEIHISLQETNTRLLEVVGFGSRCERIVTEMTAFSSRSSI